MTELLLIKSALAGAAKRRRWQRAFNGLARGLLLGGLLLLVALALYKVRPLPAWIVPASAALAGFCALAGLIAGFWRKQSLLETARWVDERKQLKERLSTALEMADSRAPEDWKQLLLTDAARHASSLNAKQFVPFILPRVARSAFVALLLCAGLCFVPTYRSKAHVAKQKQAANMKDVGQNLTEFMRREIAQRPPVLPPTQKSMEQAAEFGERLSKQSLTPSEALHDLASMTDQLAKQEQDLSRNPALKQLERAAREPGNGGASSPESLQKQIESLEKELGKAAQNADKLDELSKSLEKLKQQAAGNASKNGQAGSPSREQLSQNLADLAKSAKEAGLSLESLEEAIQALAANNTDLFLKDLDTATHDLEKLRDMAKAMQQLQEQAAKLGKDLAEQLEKGQGQAAVQSLQKMIQELKENKLSKEQLTKLTEEVQKAIKPGSQYGKVGECLNKAAGQCKAGDNPGGAQSLAEAQKELEKLLEQMADAKSMQSTLDALARAQQALSQCKGWSECQGRPGFKPGGKPGRGVGTWTEEYGWTYYDVPQSAGWDNSGIQRPDMDGKGHSDRPDDLNPNLKPDKVKGQMAPGSSMPSITLKGVSIKGTSNVKFEEAATAAQQDAQSALNQDQVPRAYQNAVRDYFDDLKK
jgi:hypothetical protein